MAPSRFASGIVVVFVTLAMSTPAFPQGKGSGTSGSTPAPKAKGTPNQSLVPPPSIVGTAPTAPFAWVDDATLLEPGTLWVGASMLYWSGAGIRETSIPVISGAIGLAPRVQLGVSMPRVVGSSDPAGPSGGLGTAFVNAKIGVFRNEARGLKVAIAPTLEILSQEAVQFGPAGQGRAQFGLPVSVGIERGAVGIYGSTGYFSPGVWYAGTGGGARIAPRVGIGVSFSRAWLSSSISDPTVASARYDISGSVSVDLTSSVGVFGSIGRTVATSDENGAGTTISIGLSLTTRTSVFDKLAGRPREVPQADEHASTPETP